MSKHRSKMSLDKDYARQLVAQGDMAAARTAYVNICSRWPSDAEAWFMLGAVTGTLGLVEECIDSCRKCLSLESGMIGAYLNLARVLLYKGNFHGTVDTCQLGLGRDPQNTDLLSILGTAEQRLQSHEQAVQSFRRALQINPNLIDVLTSLGDSLQALGDIEQAFACYQHALSSRPNDAELHRKLALIHLSADHVPQALKHYLKLLDSRPDDQSLHHDIGTIFLMIGDCNNAIQSLWPCCGSRPPLRHCLCRLGRQSSSS